MQLCHKALRRIVRGFVLQLLWVSYLSYESELVIPTCKKTVISIHKENLGHQENSVSSFHPALYYMLLAFWLWYIDCK